MIARLSGTVEDRSAATVVVDVHGIGYLVHVPTGTDLPSQGQPILLHTSLQVREESMTLYGFLTPGELALFELLLTSSGVGPKLALAALATHRPDVLRTAIATEDEVSLTAIPGVGRKVAQRLVLELRDKVGALPAIAGTTTSRAGARESTVSEEIGQALAGLGYSSAEITDALDALTSEDVSDSAAGLRLALTHLGARAAGR